MTDPSSNSNSNSPLNLILSYLYLNPRLNEQQEAAERESRRIEGERRWMGVLDKWLEGVRMEEEGEGVGGFEDGE